MDKVVINSYAEFEKYLNKEIGISEYITITQEQINHFADATFDHQWIHTNPEKAKTESPYKDTIAHGYLTVSIVPYLISQMMEFNKVKMVINYGIEEFKFSAPVIVNSQVRLRVKLHSLQNLRGITKAKMKIKLEIKDNPKPACEGIIVIVYHFDK